MPKDIGYASGNSMTNPSGATTSKHMPSMGVASKTNGSGNATTNPSMPDKALPSMGVATKSNSDSYSTTNPKTGN